MIACVCRFDVSYEFIFGKCGTSVFLAARQFFVEKGNRRMYCSKNLPGESERKIIPRAQLFCLNPPICAC